MGIGGVGSYCAEALARSGVGRLILVDGDTVAESNLNRQIMAVRETVGQAKTQAMKDRILQYRGDIEVECLQLFYNAEANEKIFDQEIDFVVDAIDTISSKETASNIVFYIRSRLFPAWGWRIAWIRQS